MNSTRKTTEPDLNIPPHSITREEEKRIAKALQAEKKLREEQLKMS
jgi:hypothetical protein